MPRSESLEPGNSTDTSDTDPGVSALPAHPTAHPTPSTGQQLPRLSSILGVSEVPRAEGRRFPTLQGRGTALRACSRNKVVSPLGQGWCSRLFPSGVVLLLLSGDDLLSYC